MFETTSTVYIRAYQDEGNLRVRISRTCPANNKEYGQIATAEARVTRPFGVGRWRLDPRDLKIEGELSEGDLRGLRTLASVSVRWNIWR